MRINLNITSISRVLLILLGLICSSCDEHKASKAEKEKWYNNFIEIKESLNSCDNIQIRCHYYLRDKPKEACISLSEDDRKSIINILSVMEYHTWTPPGGCVDYIYTVALYMTKDGKEQQSIFLNPDGTIQDANRIKLPSEREQKKFSGIVEPYIRHVVQECIPEGDSQEP